MLLYYLVFIQNISGYFLDGSDHGDHKYFVIDLGFIVYYLDMLFEYLSLYLFGL